MKTIAIHQPQFLPWVPYFTKINAANTFVFLDDVPFHKGGLQNRNQLFTKGGKVHLTVPVFNVSNQKINQVKIDYKTRWVSKILNTMFQTFNKSPAFEKHFPIIEGILNEKSDLLNELNRKLLDYIIIELGIQTNLAFSSDLTLESTGTKRLVDICEAHNCNAYISGQGGLNYIDHSEFSKRKIDIKYQNFSSTDNYNVGSNWFKKNNFDNSTIDLLFNRAPQERIWS